MTSLHSSEYAAFKKRLVQARKDAGLTQTEVAEALSKPQSFVAKCELGERRVDALELAKFAKLYDKPMGYFLLG
jgi:transcriptional regulator with XRE-family HTH domain